MLFKNPSNKENLHYSKYKAKESGMHANVLATAMLSKNLIILHIL
jgi:hypothetical protein